MSKSENEIQALFDGLVKEKQDIQDKTGPMRAECENLYEKIRPLEEKARAVSKKIKEIEQPRLSDIERQISGLAKALGGRRLSEGR